MNLYERDYTILTEDEDRTWRDLKNKEVVGSIGRFTIKHSQHHQYSKAARHFDSYFPNHYLDIFELDEKERLSTQLHEFSTLLNSDGVKEREILYFINSKYAYFLIASILTNYRFGHHGAYLFPEFQIGNSYKADYLIVGKGSGGWEFVFVELEAPNGKITRQNGDLGEAFQKGLIQIGNWDAWLDAYYSSLSETFRKHMKKGNSLPDEFTIMDKSRLHFVVVAGRRDNFKEKTYRIQRKKLYDERVLILHYDNLVDYAQNVIGKRTY